MKTLLLSLSFFLTFTACGGKDADTGTADDEFTIDAQNSEDDAEDAQGEDAGIESGNDLGSGEVMNASPGCDLTGALCYSFDGPIWPGQDTESFCNQLSSQYEAQGAPAMSYTSNGCPAGAFGECSGIPLGIL